METQANYYSQKGQKCVQDIHGKLFQMLKGPWTPKLTYTFYLFS